MRKLCFMVASLPLLIGLETGCNEVLGLDNACFSCGGAKAACIENDCPTDDDEICSSQTEAWELLAACVCNSCAKDCNALCGIGEANAGACGKCFKDAVSQVNGSCRIESASCNN